MGGTQNKGDQVNQSALNEDIKINHEKFQNFVYLEPEDLIQITLDINSEKDHKFWDGQLKRLSFFEDKEALLLPSRHQHKSKGFCGTAGAVKICYENYPYLFEEQIENRIEMGKHFEDLVTSAKDFNKIESKIGDVRPYNIFINEQGQIKIANLYSWPYQKTNFQKTAFEKTLTYLSPQEINLISKGNLQNITNRIKSQSFSIGLTLLQAGLLFQAKDLYSIINWGVDIQGLERRVGEWINLQFMGENNVVKSYSPLLKHIVTAMCNPDYRNRLTSLEVEQELRPFQNQILNLKQFDHQHVNLHMNLPSNNMSSNNNITIQQQPQQIVYSPPKPVMSIPQQSINVTHHMQPKLNSSPPMPPPQQHIITTDVKPVNSSVRFNHGQTVYMPHQLPTRNTAPQMITGAYEQQFFKYATMNPPTNAGQMVRPGSGAGGIGGNISGGVIRGSSPSTSVVRPATVQIQTQPQPQHQQNTLNYYTPGTGVPTFNQPPPFNPIIPPSSIGGQHISSSYQTSNTKVLTSMTGPVSSGEQPQSSDFLKKIDQQLQASRRQFPS